MEANKKRIAIIGNNNFGRPLSDGGRIKTRLYFELLKQEGYDASLVDLASFAKRFWIVIPQIKQAVKENNIIVIMAGPKGCRFIIPLVNRYNRKYHHRIIFIPLGIGTIDGAIKKYSDEKREKALNEEIIIKDDKMKKQLLLLDGIYVQNNKLFNLYQNVYPGVKVSVLPNFRIEKIVDDKKLFNDFHIVFISRVTRDKGIFDLLYAVDTLNKEGLNIYLDIFGDMQLDSNDKAIFDTYINERICYKGVLAHKEVVNVMSKYHLFVLPTKYYGEGTPGSLIESFFALTPSLISNYSQAQLLVNDKEDGFIYSFDNKEALLDSIRHLYDNPKELAKVSKALVSKAKLYSYDVNKDIFLKAVLGE